jgi:hypothetical protein
MEPRGEGVGGIFHTKASQRTDWLCLSLGCGFDPHRLGLKPNYFTKWGQGNSHMAMACLFNNFPLANLNRI